jgi:hypothetical protein
MDWLFQVLVPGPHELDLCLNSYKLKETFGSATSDIMASFFERARVKSLFLSGDWLLPSHTLAVLPDLQSLGLRGYGIDSSTFAGIERATGVLLKLHTISMIGCNIDDDSRLDPSLRALLSLPSVRRIRFKNCGNCAQPEEKERFHELLLAASFEAKVNEFPDLEYMLHASPFY